MRGLSDLGWTEGDEAERKRSVTEHNKFIAQCKDVEVLSSLDLLAVPPFTYAHDHFGYRDRLSQPVIEGTGEVPAPGFDAPLKPGEFILGYPDEDGPPANLPQPEILSRNGSYMAYRRLQEHVGKFRDFLRQNAQTPEEQELLAAKLMGRWRSGAPLVLAPNKDDPELAADPKRNNAFNYKEMDPQGYAIPLGSHCRRMNPRDTTANPNRRRIIRRGAPPMGHICRMTHQKMESSAASQRLCSARALSVNSSSCKTFGRIGRTSTSSVMNAIRSSAIRTVRSNLKSPSVQSARKSPDCQPSPP
jgi:hypothetical protein